MSGWRLAIDFGTSNSAAAIQLDAREPQAVRLGDGADVMPSAVFADAGGIAVGTEATRRMMLDPSAFERNPKRLMGQQLVQLGGTDLEVVDLVAAVLRTIVQRAARVAGGGLPDHLTLTYPAGYQRARRDLLVEAAVRAGFDRTRIGLLPEPVAAVARYAQNAPLPPAGTHLCVLDVGGGTCDVAVLRVTGETSRPFEVVSTAGRADLGGGLFDLRLEGLVLEAVRQGGHAEILAALESQEGLGARRALREQVALSKHALSETESTTVPVVTRAGTATITVTADEFAAAIADDVQQVAALAVEACSRAQLRPTELGTLYLTGGASLVRPLQTALARIVGQPAATLDDPKLVTCLGALSPLGQQLREAAVPPMPAPAPPATPPSAPAPAPAPQGPASVPPVAPPAALAATSPVGPGAPARSGRRLPLLIGAIVLGLLVVGGGIAVAMTLLGGDDRPGPTADPEPTRTTPTEDPDPETTCDDSPDLTPAECTLLTDVLDAGWPVDPADCEAIAPSDAQLAIACPAVEDESGFAPDGGVRIFGYGDVQTMDSAFQDVFVELDLDGPRKLDGQQGWGTWNFQNVSEDAGKILLYQDPDRDRSYVAWTDEASRIEMWAGNDGDVMSDLYDWWTSA